MEMQIQMDAAQARLNKKQKLFDAITSETKKLDAQLCSARKKNKRRSERLDTSPKRPKFDVDPEHLSSLLSEKMDDLAKTLREDSKGTFEETMGVVEDTIIESVSKKLDSIAGALKRVAPASKVDWSGIQKSMINAEKQMDKTCGAMHDAKRGMITAGDHIRDVNTVVAKLEAMPETARTLLQDVSKAMAKHVGDTAVQTMTGFVEYAKADMGVNFASVQREMITKVSQAVELVATTNQAKMQVEMGASVEKGIGMFEVGVLEAVDKHLTQPRVALLEECAAVRQQATALEKVAQGLNQTLISKTDQVMALQIEKISTDMERQLAKQASKSRLENKDMELRWAQHANNQSHAAHSEDMIRLTSLLVRPAEDSKVYDSLSRRFDALLPLMITGRAGVHDQNRWALDGLPNKGRGPSQEPVVQNLPPPRQPEPKSCEGYMNWNAHQIKMWMTHEGCEPLVKLLYPEDANAKPPIVLLHGKQLQHLSPAMLAGIGDDQDQSLQFAKATFSAALRVLLN